MADFWTQYREQVLPAISQPGLLGGQAKTAADTALDPILGQPNRQAFTTMFPWSGMVNYDDKYNVTGWKTPFQSNFMAPTSGAIGPGGAIEGAGQGATNGNPFDINAPGAGLWSAGYNVNDPQQVQTLYSALAQAGALTKPELARFAPKPGTQMSQSDLQDFLNAADWYYRDQARQVDKQNKFGDSTFGKLVLGGLTALSGSAFGPIGGAAFGAGLGSMNSDNQLLGALTGAIGGGTAGYLSQNGGIGGLLGGDSGGFVNPSGLGLSPENLYNPASLGGAVGASNGLGLGGTLGAATASNGLGLAPNLAGLLYNPASLSGTISANGVPIEDHSVPVPPNSNPPSVLEAIKDLYDANGGLTGLAGDAYDALKLTNSVSGLLSGANDAPVNSGGLLNQEWGGKFKKYQSPYGQLGRKPMKRGIQTDIAGVRG